ncbi:MAG: arginase family protein [Litoreibacter sp.]|uniref:arginase family protein n=1 Tax=Litoreibacter sp. TaxID=1969459 RepID=UPI003297B5C1
MTHVLEGELSAAERDPQTARFRVMPVDHTGALPEVISALTEAAIKWGAIPATLGGEIALSYKAVRGAARALDRRTGVVQIDAHADLRKAYQGERHSHASVMQLLTEEDCIRIAQFRVRAFCAQEVVRRASCGVSYRDAEDLMTQDIHTVDLPDDFPQDIYVSLGVDGLDPSILPATGTPVPSRLSYYQAIAMRLKAAVWLAETSLNWHLTQTAPSQTSRLRRSTMR